MRWGACCDVEKVENLSTEERNKGGFYKSLTWKRSAYGCVFDACKVKKIKMGAVRRNGAFVNNQYLWCIYKVIVAK